MTEENEPIHLQLPESLRAQLGTNPESKTEGGITYIKAETNGFDAKALRILLLSASEMVKQALSHFDNAADENNEHRMLDIVGSTLYGLAELFRVNHDTLARWHEQVCSIPKLSAEINAEVKRITGKDVDVEHMSESELEELFNEVISEEMGNDLSRLHDIIEKRNKEHGES